MNGIAKLITAIAALMWPTSLLVIVLLFRKEISNLLHRLRKGKIAGQEIELAEHVRELDEAANEVAAQLPPDATVRAADAREARQLPSGENLPPRWAIVELSARIERELVELAEVLGYAQEAKPPNVRQITRVLEKNGVFPPAVVRATELFSEARNRIVHGVEIDEREIAIALHAGRALLQAITSTAPRERHEVLHANVPFYSDPECKQLVTGATAVILQSFSPDGAIGGTSVFPTTRRDYEAGMRLGWEWDMTRVFGESWYKHPTTGARSYAWSSSADFVGGPVRSTARP